MMSWSVLLSAETGDPPWRLGAFSFLLRRYELLCMDFFRNLSFVHFNTYPGDHGGLRHWKLGIPSAIGRLVNRQAALDPAREDAPQQDPQAWLRSICVTRYTAEEGERKMARNMADLMTGLRNTPRSKTQLSVRSMASYW